MMKNILPEKAATGLVAHQLLVGKNGVVPSM